jgi:hypothetical protein
MLDVARWCLVLVAGLTVARAAAAPDPEVRIERRGDAYAVSARLAVDVDRSIAWEVITDYDRLRNFVPDMDESRIVSRPGEPTLVRQSGAWNLLGYRVPVQIVAQIDEQPMHSVRFHSVSGNVRVENGEWSIAEQGGGVTITYRVECTPDFWVPPILGTVLIRRDVRAKLERVAQEMLKRDSAQRRPQFLLPEHAS